MGLPTMIQGLPNFRLPSLPGTMDPKIAEWLRKRMQEMAENQNGLPQPMGTMSPPRPPSPLSPQLRTALGKPLDDHQSGLLERVLGGM